MDRSYPLRTFRFHGQWTVHGHVDCVSQKHALVCLRNWADLLTDRGKVHMRMSDTDNYVELRKRCWKTRPPVLIFRYRNSDNTRKYFQSVTEAFDNAGVEYAVALTRKTQRPGAIEIPLDPHDIHTPRVVFNLAARAFGVDTEDLKLVDLSCAGTIRSKADGSRPEVYIPPSEKSVAYRAGRRFGVAARRGADRLVGDPRHEG